MNRMIQFSLLILLVGLLSSCGLFKTAGGTSDQGNALAKGTVLDSEGTPMVAAKISLVPKDLHDISDQAGTTNALKKYLSTLNDDSDKITNSANSS